MTKTYGYLIIGAGPAGLQLGYFLEKNGRDYVILERGNGAGMFFETYPRHRELISINKVYTGCEDPETNLRWDWNSLLGDNPDLLFKNYSKRYFPPADELVRSLRDFARYYELNIRYDTPVVGVSKKDGHFEVTDAGGATYGGERLVVATGLSQAYVPDFPGVELCESYVDCPVDPEDFVNQRVLIVGKGNSGFETANNLTETAAVIHVLSPESLEFAWQTHYVGNLRAVNNNFIDTYHLKSQNTVIDASIDRIERRDDGKLSVDITFSHARGQRQTILYDRIILCTGFRFDPSIFDPSCRLEMTIKDKFPAQTGEWESVNVPGLYFAGTLMQACDYRKTMSGFIHGFRHNIEAMSHIFEQKYHGRPWPCKEIPATARGLLEKIVDRVVRSPGLFLQPGFLCDVAVVPENGGAAEYFEDIPVNYLRLGGFDEHQHYYTITLEYGPKAANPFAVERDPDPAKAHEASYLHPIIRRYNRGTQINEHHVHDDLENEWWKDNLTAPARAFLEAEISAHQLAAV